MKMPRNEDNNFKKNFNETRKKESKNKKSYIALGICVLAVSAIAWSTYQSVNTFISPFKDSSVAKAQNKSSKIMNSETNKSTILNEDDASDYTSGKSIPYGREKDNKSKNLQKSAEKSQPVSASPSNLQIAYPVDSKDILKEFSEGKPIYSATMGDWRTHEGIDFKSGIGSKVKSVAEGVVRDVYKDPSYGISVLIEHAPGFMAYYSGLDEKQLIEKGKKVKSGETIGILGKVPCEISDPPHLHFSIFKDSQFINPAIMFEAQLQQPNS